jgi:hypothetical protein
MAREPQSPQGDVIERERINPDTGEVLTTKTFEVVEAKTTGVNIGGQTFNLVKRVNLPTLKHDSGETVAFRIDAPIREELSMREVKLAGGQTGQEEVRINVVRVTEASSKREFEYVCNAMTADNIRGAYQDHSYVGHWFAVQKLGVVAGKRYKETNVIEIEPAG